MYPVLIIIPIVLAIVILGCSSHSPNKHRNSPMKLIDPGVLMCANAVIMISVDSMGVVCLIPRKFIISRDLCRS